MRKIKMKSSTRDIILVGMDSNIAWEARVDIAWEHMENKMLETKIRGKTKPSTWLQEWAEDADMAKKQKTKI